jgi:hypothetical protein
MKSDDSDGPGAPAEEKEVDSSHTRALDEDPGEAAHGAGLK